MFGGWRERMEEPRERERDRDNDGYVYILMYTLQVVYLLMEDCIPE